MHRFRRTWVFLYSKTKSINTMKQTRSTTLTQNNCSLQSNIISFIKVVFRALFYIALIGHLDFFHLNTVCAFTQRTVTALETEKTRTQIQRRGHGGIFMTDPDSKTEMVSTFRAAYIPPKSPGVRLRGMCLSLSQATVRNHFISCHYNTYTLDMYFRGVEKRFYSDGSLLKNI